MRIVMSEDLSVRQKLAQIKVDPGQSGKVMVLKTTSVVYWDWD